MELSGAIHKKGTAVMTTYEYLKKQCDGRTCDLDTALVGQKNDLLTRINNAEDADLLADCLETLRLLAPVWRAVRYGYKATEVARRIETAATHQANAALSMRDTSPRKGWGQWNTWNREYIKCEAVIAAAASFAQAAN